MLISRKEERECWLSMILTSLEINFFFYNSKKYGKFFTFSSLSDVNLYSTMSSRSNSHTITASHSTNSGIIYMGGKSSSEMDLQTARTRLINEHVCVIHVMSEQPIGLYPNSKYLMSNSVRISSGSSAELD